MATEETLDSNPNLPVVPVRGVTTTEAWLLFERYNLSIQPASDRELKLCEVIIALEGMVEDLGRTVSRRAASE